MKLMLLMKAIWEFMNGKKTSTGAVLLLVSAALSYFDLNVDSEQLKIYIDALESSGALAFIAGISHKIVKYLMEEVEELEKVKEKAEEEEEEKVEVEEEEEEEVK